MSDGTVLVLGGSNGNTALSSIETYTYVSDTGTVRPKFVLVSIGYAPPGSGSNVNYSNSSTLGTNFSFGESLSNSASLKITESYGPKDAAEGEISETTGWTKQIGGTNSYGLTKTSSATDIVPGPSGPGLDHNSDVYFVWLNPIFDVSVTPNASTFLWNNIAYDPADKYGMDVMYLYGADAQNPSGQLPGVAARTGRDWDRTLGALNSTDYQTILHRNPFVANPNYDPNAVDPTTGAFRFQSVQSQPINYVPAPAGSQPVTHQQIINYTTTTGSGTSSKDDYSESFNVTTKSGIFLTRFNASLTNTTQLEITNSYSGLAAHGQSSSLSVTGPKSTDGYTGTSAFGLYQDNIYGTFMFYPISVGRPAAYSDQGTTTTTNPSAFQSAGGTATVTGEADHFQFGSRPTIPHRNPGICIWSNFGTGTASTAKTLYLNYSISGASDDDTEPGNTWNYNANVEMSLDGGSTWLGIANPNANGQSTASIPAGTDLSQVQVKASVTVNIYSSDIFATASMPISLMVVQ